MPADPVWLPLSELACDDDLQARAGGLDEKHLTRLAAAVDAGAELAPIQAVRLRHPRTGETRAFVVDGHHTHETWRRAGRDVVPAVVVDGTWADAVLAAVRANWGHGKPLEPEDKRRAVDMVLAQWPNWSDPKVAAAVGMSREWVRQYRLKLDEAGAVKRPAVVETADGGTRPVSVKPPSEGTASVAVSSDDGATDADEPAVVTEPAPQVSPPGTPEGQTCAALVAEGNAHLARAISSYSRAAGAEGADDDDRDFYVLADEVRQLARRWRVG